MATEKRMTDANALLTEVVKLQALEPDKAVAKIIMLITDDKTVDAVEVVHGRWLDVKETEMYVPDKKYTVTHTAETCSNCKVRIGFIGGKQYLYDNQCPNCGAMMDGDGDG